MPKRGVLGEVFNMVRVLLLLKVRLYLQWNLADPLVEDRALTMAIVLNSWLIFEPHSCMGVTL
jgi:hypothetical protein